MKIRTDDLIDEALDWAVASIETKDKALDIVFDDNGGSYFYIMTRSTLLSDQQLFMHPSRSPAQGQVIQEREKINLSFDEENNVWRAEPHNMDSICQRKKGDTSLVAAMGCFVFSRLGGEVDVPDQLLAQAEEESTRQVQRHSI